MEKPIWKETSWSEANLSVMMAAQNTSQQPLKLSAGSFGFFLTISCQAFSGFVNIELFHSLPVVFFYQGCSATVAGNIHQIQRSAPSPMTLAWTKFNATATKLPFSTALMIPGTIVAPLRDWGWSARVRQVRIYKIIIDSCNQAMFFYDLRYILRTWWS